MKLMSCLAIVGGESAYYGQPAAGKNTSIPRGSGGPMCGGGGIGYSVRICFYLGCLAVLIQWMFADGVVVGYPTCSRLH